MSTVSVRDICYIRNNLYKCRRKLQPSLPKTIEDVLDILGKSNISTIRQEDFVFINDQTSKIVVFSSYLCSSEKMYLDGTFSYCAQHFLQLFTIHTMENGHYS